MRFKLEIEINDNSPEARFAIADSLILTVGRIVADDTLAPGDTGEVRWMPRDTRQTPRKVGMWWTEETTPHCIMLGNYQVQHWDCSEYPDGTITDVRTGKVVTK